MELLITLPAIVLLVIGLVVCFFGYRFFRLSLALIGGGIGFFLSEFLFDKYAVVFSLENSDIAHLIFILVFTIGLGSAAFAMYMKAAMLVTIVGTGYWVYSGYRIYSGQTDIKTAVITWLIGLGIGFILGFAVKSIQRWAVILFTAVGGSQITSALAAPFMISNDTLKNIVIKIAEVIFPGLTGNPEVILSGILLIMLFTAGVIVQSQGKK